VHVAAAELVAPLLGEGRVRGAADAVLVLKRERLKTDAVLAVTGRDVIEQEYALKLRDGVRWWLDGEDLVAAADAVASNKAHAEDVGKLGDMALWVLATVNSRPHVTTGIDEVYAAWPEKPTDADAIADMRESIGQTLRRLHKADRILKVGRGQYMPHTTPEGK
jgi:hypothetical protein